MLALVAPAASRAYLARDVTLVVPCLLPGPIDIRRASRMNKTDKLMAAHAPPAINCAPIRMRAQ